MMESFNKKTWMLGALTGTLLIALIMPSLPFASSENVTICDARTVRSGTFDNVLVKPGISCKLTDSVMVLGNIYVESGAVFSASKITIGGNVQTDGAKSISLSKVIINGNVQIKNIDSKRTVNIAGSTIHGDIQLENNSAYSILVILNTIDGNIKFIKNTSISKDGNKITGNTVGANLDCGNKNSNIVLIPISKFGPNDVSGAKTGQCINLM